MVGASRGRAPAPPLTRPAGPPPAGDRAPGPAIAESSGRRAVSARERTYRRATAAADAFAAIVAFLAIEGVPGAGTTWIGLVALPLLVVLGSKLYGLYDRDDLVIRKTTLEEAPRIFHLTSVAVVVLWMTDDIVLEAPLTRARAVLFGAALLALTLVARRAARSWCRQHTEAERCVLIGDSSSYDRVARRLSACAHARLVACLPLSAAHAGIDHESGGVEALQRVIAGFDAHRVIIEPADGAGAAYMDVVRGAKRVGVRVSILPRVFDVVEAAVERDELSGLTLLGLRQFGLTRSSELLKRAMDVIGSAATLVLLSPGALAVALAIRLDSHGPVLFRQRRIGRHGRPFEILKFRTMVADAEARKPDLEQRNEAEGIFKIADDPRITRVGRVLRATCLDEAPQLINVLRGQMSLVGPRPLIADEDSRVVGLDRRRLDLKPGMTGPWQIAGSARVPLTEMVKIDYRYAADWSVWNDVKILLRTVPFMFARQGM